MEERFIGNRGVVRRLERLKNQDGVNLFLVGRAGMGKTMLAKLFALDYLEQRSIPLSEEYVQFIHCSAELPEIISNPRLLIFDEAHVLREWEQVYRFMDSAECCTIFTSNIDIPTDAAESRSYVFILEDYSDEEKIQMLEFSAQPTPTKQSVVQTLKGLTPRELIKIFKELDLYGELTPWDWQSILDIERSLFPLEQEYIESLESLGNASIRTLSGVLGLSENMVKRVEMRLLKNRIIKITSKGRQICT